MLCVTHVIRTPTVKTGAPVWQPSSLPRSATALLVLVATGGCNFTLLIDHIEPTIPKLAKFIYL